MIAKVISTSANVKPLLNLFIIYPFIVLFCLEIPSGSLILNFAFETLKRFQSLRQSFALAGFASLLCCETAPSSMNALHSPAPKKLDIQSTFFGRPWNFAILSLIFIFFFYFQFSSFNFLSANQPFKIICLYRKVKWRGGSVLFLGITYHF